MYHCLRTRQQLTPCAGIAQVAGHGLDLQITPVHTGRIATDQDPHLPAGGGKRSHQMATDETGRAGDGDERRICYRPRLRRTDGRASGTERGWKAVEDSEVDVSLKT